MATPKKYPVATRAEAVARLLAGESPKAIARALSVPESTLRDWRDIARNLVAQWVEEDRARSDAAPKQNHAWLDDQIWGLVGDSIAALRAVAKKAQDDAWLTEQSASSLAVFFGVLSDKLVRVLAALEPYQATGPDDNGDDAGTAALAVVAGETAQP